MDERIGTSVHTGALIAVLGVFAWASGLPAVFPSLGPSAFVLATHPDSEASDPRRVIGSHTIGVAAGLLAYHALAPGLVLTRSIAPFSLPGLQLAASSVCAIVLTVGGILSVRVRHPPACATTLIVALGLLSSPLDGVVIVLAVVMLVAVQSVIVPETVLSKKASALLRALSARYRRRVE